ncbi:MAG: hypothetical protein PUB34_05200 [Clostridia bacterium]|nr:hypothetical protein [Clostridia bacterium]
MLKLIVGVKGTGKTKELITMCNKATEETNGCVVCLEKGNKLIHEITYKTRLVDTDIYDITNADALYGLICGMYASNHDITHFFIDSALKICLNDMDKFKQLLSLIDAFSEKNNLEFVITSSIPVENIDPELKKYID